MSSPGGLLAQIQEKAAEVADDPKRFGVYREDPIGFANDILGIPLLKVGSGTPEDPDVPGLTPKQVEVLQSVLVHHDVAIRSGHGVGKTFLMSVLCLWWLYGRQGIVITTAGSWDQVEEVLWQEILAMWEGAKVKLPGAENLTQIRVGHRWYASGRSVAKSTSFQGRHHTDLLVLIDEAPGIEDKIHEAINSLTVSEGNRIVMVGNPTEMSGAFHRAFHNNTGWYCLHMDCLDHPNIVHGREIIPGAITRRKVEKDRAEYGEDSPLFQARIRGNFPEAGSDQVFPAALIDRAMGKEEYEAAQKDPAFGKQPTILALDPARFGSNRTVLVQRKGGVIVEIKAWVGQDAERTQDEVVALWKATGAVAVIIDEVGLGGPILDGLQRRGVPCYGHHSGKPARDNVYRNRRAELWMRVRREWFETDRVRLPAHDQLRRDLLGARYKFDSGFRIVLDAKRDMDSSPDFADAVLMSLAWEWEAEAPENQSRIWGVDTNTLPGEGDEGLAGGLPDGF